MKRVLALILLLCMLLPTVPHAKAYKVGQPYHAQLEDLIKNEDRRAYIQMMLDYYLRTDILVQEALKKNTSAIFLFDGGSDNMDHPDLFDISYYRVSAVCIALRLDEEGNPFIAYFNDDSSTLPDRPLEIGAWKFDDVGEVGPATICDGSYELYSVRHAGSYEALHVRTDFADHKIDAVYMKPDGYVKARATEINIHTRTGNHILKTQMWSAGCILVGGGEWSHFTELMESTYYANYDKFALGRYVGSLTVNRQLLREPMYKLYRNKDAVDRIMTVTRQQDPARYLKQCKREKTYETPVDLCVRGNAWLMSLPCSNSTDARSVALEEVTRGQELTATGTWINDQGRIWYEIFYEEKTCYLYSGYAEESSWRNWITRAMA